MAHFIFILFIAYVVYVLVGLAIFYFTVKLVKVRRDALIPSGSLMAWSVSMVVIIDAYLIR